MKTTKKAKSKTTTPKDTFDDKRAEAKKAAGAFKIETEAKLKALKKKIHTASAGAKAKLEHRIAELKG